MTSRLSVKLVERTSNLPATKETVLELLIGRGPMPAYKVGLLLGFPPGLRVVGAKQPLEQLVAMGYVIKERTRGSWLRVYRAHS